MASGQIAYAALSFGGFLSIVNADRDVTRFRDWLLI